MKRLLFGLLALGLSCSVFATTALAPWDYPQYVGRGKGSHYSVECYFQTTGDNIPIHIFAVNFKSDPGTLKTGPFVIPYPGATSLIFTGTSDPAVAGLFSVVNNDYHPTSEAHSILLIDCVTRALPPTK